MSDLEHDDDESRCWRCQDRIEALEAELAAAKTVNREVLSRENDELRAINDKLRDDVVALKARIEALEAAGKRLAEAVEASNWLEFMGDDVGLRVAIAAWRAAEGGGDE